MHSRKLITLCATILVGILAGTGVGGALSGTKKEVDLGAVIKLIESHYQAKRVEISTAAKIGAATAKTAAKVVSSKARRFLRYGDFKLAVFEDQDFSADPIAFHSRMRETLEPEWLPLVAVRARDDAQTFTYTKEENGQFKVIVVVIEQRDAVAVQINLNTQEFVKLLRDPADESRHIADEAAAADDESAPE